MVERREDGSLVIPCSLGRYRLLHQIGRGGSATVYVASMTGKGGFERTVAVKVLHRHLTSDPTFVAMFLDEARLCARIRHPNVVDVYDVDAIAGELIIVMDYVEGLPLNKLLAQKGKRRLPVPLGLRIIHDALRGLHAAHELKAADGGLVGLIHRDMTPHNVLVSVDGVVQLADFGIAKARGRITTTDSDILKGKLRYLAPEQLTPNLTADRRLDVFAAGIVLWETLCHRALFRGDTEAELLANVLACDIEPPSKVNELVSQEIDEICMKALTRDRDERYESAEAFADALEDARGHSMASARMVGRWISERSSKRLDETRDAVNAARPEEDAVPSSDTAVRMVRSSDSGEPSVSSNIGARGDDEGGSTNHDMPSVSMTWAPKPRVSHLWPAIALIAAGGAVAAAWNALRDAPLTAQAGVAVTAAQLAVAVTSAPVARPSAAPSAQPSPSAVLSTPPPAARPRPRRRVESGDDLPTGI